MYKGKAEQFASWSFRETTPDGTAFITIVEERPGTIYKIFMHIGKGSSSLNSWCKAVAELCTLYLSQGGTIGDLIEVLFDIISSSSIRLRTGPDEPINRSGAEAMASALRQYLQSLPQSVIEEIGERKGGLTANVG